MKNADFHLVPAPLGGITAGSWQVQECPGVFVLQAEDGRWELWAEEQSPYDEALKALGLQDLRHARRGDAVTTLQAAMDLQARPATPLLLDELLTAPAAEQSR